MATKADNPFNKPGTGGPEGYISGKLNQHNREASRHTGTAKDQSRGLTQEQYDTDPIKLNKNQNANNATDGGQYGRLNNRSYATTLRLAREADEYNNRPRAHMFMITGNGAQDMGTGYDKPALETMETRAMDQSFELDTNQKRLAQALQDAVNHKDLEAFKDLYKQLFGITLDEMQAKLKMTEFARSSEMRQMLQKDMTAFIAYFQRAFGAETAATLYNMMDTNPLYAKMLGNMIAGGNVPPEYEEMLSRDFIMQQRADLIGKGVSPEAADEMAKLNLNKMYDEFNNAQAAQASRDMRFYNRIGADKSLRKKYGLRN